jgi:hypothetical protein
MASPQQIGNRISIAHHPDAFTVVITQEIPRTSFALLVAWWGAWWAVGVVFAVQWATTEVADERMFFTISLAFWAYFAFRVGKVIAWRKWGRELIRITPSELSVKNAFGAYGRAVSVPLSSVERMEVVKRDPRKFLHSMDQSFWILGGDTLVVRSSVRRLPMGKQLSEREAGALAKSMDEAMRKLRKAH